MPPLEPTAPDWPSGAGTREGWDPSESVNRTGLSAELLTHARNTLPHPVARAVRSLQQAHTPKDQYEALLDAAETLAITVSVTTAALLHEKSPTDGQNWQESGQRNLSILRNAYFGSGATFGTWTAWLDDPQPLAGSRPYLPAGLFDAFQSKPGDPGIIEHLKALKKERNRAAHGNKPKSQPESAARFEECAPRFESILARAQFLEETPWMFTISCVYQRSSQSFAVLAGHAMGDHPDFERRSFTLDDPVSNDTFYVLGPEGPITLSPFVANLFCTQCQQVEVCYAYKAVPRKNVATFKSFGRGHEILAPEMIDELQSLPDRRPSQ